MELTPEIYDLAKKHFAERKVGTAFGAGGSQVGLTLEQLLDTGAMRRLEFLIEWGLFGCALLSIGTTIGIIAVLTIETAGFLREVPITEFLFGTEWTPLFATPRFGVLPLVAGTLLVSVIAMLVALPMGLLSAVYLSEYAGQGVAPHRQAGARDSGGRPDGRLRLLRAALRDAAAAAGDAGPRRLQCARARES